MTSHYYQTHNTKKQVLKTWHAIFGFQISINLEKHSTVEKGEGKKTILLQAAMQQSRWERQKCFKDC